MDPEHRKIITDNIETLAKLIDVNFLVPFLLQEKIFTKMMLDDVYEKDSKMARTLELLKELPSRGPHAFRKFVAILEQSGHKAAASLLVREAASFEPKAGEVCPSEINIEHPVELINSTDHSHQGKSKSTEAPLQLRVKATKELKRGPNIYRMESIPRGYCMIINNVDFGGILDTRLGSGHDVARLEMVFKNLDYDVSLLENLESLDMITALKAFADKVEHEDVDSCVVIILSHGMKGSVYGTDSKTVEVVEILEIFDNHNCRRLQKKPKMFFIQACRGRLYDFGVPPGESSDSAISRDKPSGSKNKIPSHEERMTACSDMMISYSVVEGYISIRHMVLGSWYGQSLATTLMNRACDSELTEILQEIDRNVKRMTSAEGEKQATEFTFKGWDKKLYFNPR